MIYDKVFLKMHDLHESPLHDVQKSTKDGPWKFFLTKTIFLQVVHTLFFKHDLRPSKKVPKNS